MTYADCDPLVRPDDLARIEESVRRAVPLPTETQFTAYRVVQDGLSEAHLFLATPHPGEVQKKYGSIHATQARIQLATWEEYLKRREHFVDTREDKLMKAFLLMANRHADELNTLRNITN